VNAQNGINFSENCTIVQQKDRIKVRAVDQAGTANQMPQPPNPALSLADRQKITDWVNAGGKFTD
jgi:cytochrome c551/c552